MDQACNEIKAREKKLNLLFMSQGTIVSLEGRDGTPSIILLPSRPQPRHLLTTSLAETSEGLDKKRTTNYYSRIRFTQQLLPLLQAASPPLSRVVSVLAPGDQAALDLDDLGLKKDFSMWKAATHAVTMTDFTFETMAEQNPNVSFIHTFPRVVKTGFAKEQGSVVRAASQLAYTVLSRWTVGIEESGERHLYAATSAAYPPKGGGKRGVEIEDGEVKKGSAGEIGSGAYLVGSDGDVRANEKMLKELRGKDAGAQGWEHTIKTFEEVRGSPDV